MYMHFQVKAHAVYKPTMIKATTPLTRTLIQYTVITPIHPTSFNITAIIHLPQLTEHVEIRHKAAVQSIAFIS